MATIQTITKAGVYSAALNKILGSSPEMDVKEKYITVYYPAGSTLIKAQQGFKKLVESPPGEIRMQLAPVIAPYYLKKAVPFLAGALVAGYIAGKLF